MTKRTRLLLVAGGCLIGCVACARASVAWTQLSLSTCRVDEFIAANPAGDGRGVVIAVLDTGVDPSIPGLTHTPDGEVKVIDVQDFSGQGDVELHRVQFEDGKLIDYDDDGAPIHYVPPTVPADTSGETRRWWLGFFTESRFVNSDVPDLNDNGTTDDRFPICVTALSGDGDDQALAFVDRNLDRSFGDEKALRNYNLAYDTFTLFREKPEKQIVPVAFAVNIFLRQAKISVVYDDGAHGTHVAGIAAGYRINNQDGFNGVAPGAKVIGLKISQNARGGPSTTESVKRAVEHAARFGREHNLAVVCNMSFGVESVIEGHSDIDKLLDKFLVKHPEVVFCTSAGNEGPGLSTVGTPAAAAQAVTVAALLAADSARDVMGIDIDQAVATGFTSRGGESNKPDLATPGWSTSTVPRWVTRGDFWAGTSMASPYAAGLCAALISNARTHHAKVRAWDVRRALCLSAAPVPNATVLDVGYGMPDMPKAAKLLDKLLKSAPDDPIIGYDINTACPHGYGGKARAAYWRSIYHPTAERQTFVIEPVFAPTADAGARTEFTRKFDLRSNSPWCKVTQQQVYLRSAQSANVYVEYDETQLTEPGLHVGTVDALADGEVAFRLTNAIIVPHRAKAEDNFRLSFKGQTVDGWKPDRYFLTVPPGASAMKLTLAAPENTESKARMSSIYDPNGAQLYRRNARLDTTDANREAEWTLTDELIPGVWEIPILADRPDRQWPYDFDVRFFGLHAEPKRITEWSGSPPEGEVTVTNLFERPLPATVDGLFEGFRKYAEDNFTGLKDSLTYTLTLDEDYDRVRIDLEMDPEAYATTTDIGVTVEADGEQVYSSAFSNRTMEATIAIPDVGEDTSVTLTITGGFAAADDKRETPITVRFDQLLAKPIAIDVTHGEAGNVDFVPSVPITLDFAVKEAAPETPGGLNPIGYLRIRERSTNDVALRVPITIGG